MCDQININKQSNMDTWLVHVCVHVQCNMDTWLVYVCVHVQCNMVTWLVHACVCHVGYTSITCLKILNIPYNLIFTTKFNDSSIFITIFSWDYLNLSLANDHVGYVTIPIFFSSRISQSDCSIHIKLNYIQIVSLKNQLNVPGNFQTNSVFWKIFSFSCIV